MAVLFYFIATTKGELTLYTLPIHTCINNNLYKCCLLLIRYLSKIIYWNSRKICVFNFPLRKMPMKLKRCLLVNFHRLQSQNNQTVVWIKSNWAWWRHQMETFSSLLAICAGNSPVTGEFPAQRPVTRSFHIFFDLCLNKRLSKQWWGCWFQMPPRAHYDVTVID